MFHVYSFVFLSFERQRQREIFSGSLPKCPQQPVGSGQSQKPGARAGSSMRVTGTQAPVPSQGVRSQEAGSAAKELSQARQCGICGDATALSTACLPPDETLQKFLYRNVLKVEGGIMPYSMFISRARSQAGRMLLKCVRV